MKNLNLNKWVFIIPVIALILFGSYYISKNTNSAKNNNAVKNINSDEKIPAALLQEAIRQNISVSEKDVDKAIEVLMKKANMTEEQYHRYILTTYPTLNAFRAKITDNLKIIKLVNENVNLSSITVTDEDIDNFINENKEFMPLRQLENDTQFKEKFYRLAKQQIIQKRQQQLINEYINSILKKDLTKQ